ncbi:PREDICTED: lipid transfer-like protein VAS [Ipomoea nil]|uniref:lipid transfer-like protein VAS n=1 Tax=Ipomoea nil TaxID=35883 RepID=UPI000900DEC4|nr:PREDICTED: lipid transfer-like protein VAS [Ipomoea nil]
MASTKMLATAIAALAAVLMLTATATAQSTSCASNLVPCAEYLNSTKPPASCCDPLKETVTKELSCLCNLYKNPEVLKSLGVNITQALELPKHCGISNDVSACDKALSPTAATNTTPPSVPQPPPATPSGVSRFAWAEVSSLLLLGASIILW